VNVWDRITYELVTTLEHHTSFVNALDMTLDGQFLVSTSADQSIAVWDLNTLSYRGSIPWKNTLVNAVAIRSTGSTWQVIAGGQGSSSIHIWNYDSGENPPPPRP
ncbi:MAG: hypothetical protein F6K36_31160, partial [Symploca sp. SIO3C6]|nr:hypothetical protein [Symploca sp. SIO3C6]